jgi:hypothetical protein
MGKKKYKDPFKFAPDWYPNTKAGESASGFFVRFPKGRKEKKMWAVFDDEREVGVGLFSTKAGAEKRVRQLKKKYPKRKFSIVGQHEGHLWI